MRDLYAHRQPHYTHFFVDLNSRFPTKTRYIRSVRNLRCLKSSRVWKTLKYGFMRRLIPPSTNTKVSSHCFWAVFRLSQMSRTKVQKADQSENDPQHENYIWVQRFARSSDTGSQCEYCGTILLKLLNWCAQTTKFLPLVRKILPMMDEHVNRLAPFYAKLLSVPLILWRCWSLRHNGWSKWDPKKSNYQHLASFGGKLFSVPH